jgi:rhodanese-related sulfurtransferase
MIFEFLAEQYILVGAGLLVIFLLLKHENNKAGTSATPQMLSDLVNKQGGIVLDIREGKEFRAGHITDSIHMTFNELDKRITEISAHKDKPVIVVCKMGQTSGAATKRLKEEGFTQVYKLSGGIGEWTASSFPLVKS